MVRVKLTQEERDELLLIKSRPSSELSERALMVLLSDEGDSPVKISLKLRRNAHTVRDWLKRYIQSGVAGLYRNYSPGRPADLRLKIEQMLDVVLIKSPHEYGYPLYLWTTALLLDYFKGQGIDASLDTIERALKARGYRYKRPAKSVCVSAPDKDAKKKAVLKIIENLKQEVAKGDCEVFALDEAHFSTEPYLVKGWQKKLWPPHDSDTKDSKKNVGVWRFKLQRHQVLLEMR